MTATDVTHEIEVLVALDILSPARAARMRALATEHEVAVADANGLGVSEFVDLLRDIA